MAHLLRLISGDKRSPTNTFDISNDTANVYLQSGGFSPGHGADQVIFSGRTSRFDGQRRVASSRDNVELTIQYHLNADSTSELAYTQREINRIFTDTRLFEENRVGEPVYLEYRWADSLPNTAPAWGQYNTYYRVLWGDVETWPASLHTGQLTAGYLEGLEIRLICEPYAEGLDQQLLHANGVPGVDADVDLELSFTSSEFASDFTIAGWIEHRASDYYVFEYYVGAAEWLNVWWDQSDGRFELRRRVASSTTTENGAAQTLSAGDRIHIAVIQDHTTDTNIEWFVNGVSQGTVTSNAWANSGTLSLGVANSDATPTGNANGLDAWRLWEEDWTAANILTLYNNEAEVKGTASQYISQPPYLKSQDGAGTFDNVDGVISSSDQENWGIVGNVPGDVEAKVRWEIDPPTSNTSRVYWLGRKAVTATFTPEATLWLDFSETADVGNSSGDAYEANVITTEVTYDSTINEHAYTRGRHTVLGRGELELSSDIEPYFQLGSSTEVRGDTIVQSSTTGFEFFNFGDILIDWPDTTPPTMKAGLIAEQNTTASILTSCLGWWEMEEASGATRTDSQGSKDLTDNSTVNQISGKVGNAADFSGSDYLSRTSGAGDMDLGDGTISLWVKLDTTASTMDIVSKWQAAGSNLSYLIRYDTAASRFRFIASSDGSSTDGVLNADTFGAPSTATWYHIFCTFDDTANEMSISINNGTADTTTLSGINNGTADFTVGASHGGVSFLNGQVDELAVWNRVLTSAEHTELYNGGSGRGYPGSFNLDFVQLMPSPSCRVECEAAAITVAANDTLVINGRDAWIEDSSDSDSQLYHMIFSGEQVTVVPNYYNYLFLLMGEEGVSMTINQSATVTGYVTPRYLLPGGLS